MATYKRNIKSVTSTNIRPRVKYVIHIISCNTSLNLCILLSECICRLLVGTCPVNYLPSQLIYQLPGLHPGQVKLEHNAKTAYHFAELFPCRKFLVFLLPHRKYSCRGLYPFFHCFFFFFSTTMV